MQVKERDAALITPGRVRQQVRTLVTGMRVGTACSSLPLPPL